MQFLIYVGGIDMDYKLKILRSLFCDDIEEDPNKEMINTLFELVEESYSKHTFEGYIASLLISHQLVEEIIKWILDECQFYVQVNLLDTEIDFKIQKNRSFGYYLSELERALEFPQKEELIEKCKEFNIIRIEIVHRLTKLRSITDIESKVKNAKTLFDEIYDLYTDTLSFFSSAFKEIRKYGDWIYVYEEYEEELIELKEKDNSISKQEEEYISKIQDLLDEMERYVH